MPDNPFNAAYYQKFYINPRTRVTTATQLARRAALIVAVLRQLELPAKSILDAGCGLGLMRPTLLQAFPAARYVGLEVSDHLCARLGWINASIAQFTTRSRFDLVICNDVLQYLGDRQAARAIANLGRLCRGALYFQAPTMQDWRCRVDTSCSDAEVHLRTMQWYRQRLSRGFRHVGFGVHVLRALPVVQWELEMPC